MVLVVAVIGIIASLVGIPVTYLVARRSRRRPELRFKTDFDVLLAPEDRLVERGLSLSFKGEAVQRISRTYIALWNEKGDTIRGTDIVAADPLRIICDPDDTVLLARVLHRSRPSNSLTCEPLNGSPQPSVLISFDFLDSDDGGIIEILHQSHIEPTLTGAIRGTRIKDEGAASLTADDLSWFSASRRRRMLLRISRDRRTRANAILPVAAVALWGSLLIPPLFHSRPHLVPTRDYNLQTITGQKKFYNSVGSAQPSGENWYLVGLVSGIGAVYIALFLIGLPRQAVPSSIVKDGIDLGAPT